MLFLLSDVAILLTYTSYFVRLVLGSRMKKVAPPPPPFPSSASMKQPLSNGSVLRRPTSAPGVQRPASMSSCTPGEDCAFDELLEGRTEIEVVLPDLKIVRMTVDRRTPMMDFLVQATTANKISPGGHVINVVSKDDRNVHYKPNTPIGSLDTNIVYIVPKAAVDIPVKRMPKLPNQPFEQTFRLQVNLPRNQRMVLRVSPRITLAELKRQICYEKELDHSNHHLVHPAQPDTILDLNSTLEVYGCAEISLMSNSGLRDSIRCTSTNLIAYPRVEEEKKKKGILRLFSRKKKEVPMENNSNGMDSRGVSPTRSDMSVQGNYQPKQSTKRKPAPAPPPPPVHPPPSPPLVIQSSSSLNSRPESEISAKTDEAGSTVSHSRHSSDSSGYHEPSVFSDCSENKSPEASIVHGGNVLSSQDTLSSKEVVDTAPVKRISTPSKELSNLKTVPSCSSTSISTSRKRKAPQPPAPVLHEVETPPSPEQPADSPLTVSLEKSGSVSVTSSENETGLGLSVVSSTSEIPHQEMSPVLGQEQSQLSESDETKPVSTTAETSDSGVHAPSQQESEALNYLEKVLDESEHSSKSCENEFIDSDKVLHHRNSCTNSEAQSSEVFEERIPEKTSVLSSTSVSSVPPADTSSLDPSSQHSSSEDASETPIVPSSTDADVKEINASFCDDKNIGNMQHKHYENIEDLKDVSAASSKLGESCDNEKLSVSAEKTVERSAPVEIISAPETSISTNVCNLKPVNEISEVPSHCKETNKSSAMENSSDTFTTLSVKTNSTEGTSNVILTPSSNRKLINFALSCYQNEEKDIFSVPPPNNKDESKHVETQVKKETETSTIIHKKTVPNVKIVPFEEREEQSHLDKPMKALKGQVQERCKQLSDMGKLPLTGRSASLFNLTPVKKRPDVVPLPDNLIETVEGLKRAHSDQNLSQDKSLLEDKSDLFQEQKRLHDEYLKLQAQFISWQKQLLNNQSLLQREQITSPLALPSLEGLQFHALPSSSSSSSAMSLNEPVLEEYKTRSLPRSKPYSSSSLESNRPETPPVYTSSKSKQFIVTADINTITETRTQKSKNEVKTSKTDGDKLVIEQNTNSSSSESKSVTLPRQIVRPSSAQEISRTMTLNRNVRPKSPVVAVTIGSWQQRNEAVPDIDSASVASSRSMFQSLENIPSAHKMAAHSFEKKKMQLNSTEKQVNNQRIYTSTAKMSMKVSETDGRISAGQKKQVNSIDVQEKSSPSSTSSNELQKSRQRSNDLHDDIIVIESHTILPKPESVAGKSSKSKVADDVQKQAKVEVKHESGAHHKFTKPLVRLISMKDEVRPPQIHGLRKWPLAEIDERSSGVYEKVNRAEVDLRKRRALKSDVVPSKNETVVTQKQQKEVKSKTVVPQNEDSGQTQKQSTDVKGPKLHITKVNINSDSKISSNYSDFNSSTEKKTVKSSIPSSISEPVNSELKNVLAKRSAASKSVDKLLDTSVQVNHEHVENQSAQSDKNKRLSSGSSSGGGGINGNTSPPPPPPPMPNSFMPVIPPASSIPLSSQLLIDSKIKETQKQGKNHTRTPTKDPREELMLEIRGFGGKRALRKVPAVQNSWHLKVYGSTSTTSS